ncbi:MAG: sugar transferase [Ruminococcus sp.]|nr:sugar transferase [Ruminococcus sp.]
MDITMLKEHESQVIKHKHIVESRTHKVSLTYRIAKRVFDFTAFLLAGIVLIIPIVLISMTICLKDHGSPFYKQKHVGKDGSPLYI